MGAWAIVGLVFASLALLVAALLCIPGRLLVAYDAQTGLRLRGSVLCFTFGEKKQKPKKEKPPKKEKKEEEPPKAAAEKRGASALKALSAHAGELADLLGQMLRQLGKIARSVVVSRQKNIHISMSHLAMPTVIWETTPKRRIYMKKREY